MFVQFISDNSDGGQGFKIRYEAKSLGKYFLWELYNVPEIVWFLLIHILGEKCQVFLG